MRTKKNMYYPKNPKARLPRKVKKEMKKHYQGCNEKGNITCSLYDGFTWCHWEGNNNKYYGKIRKEYESYKS